MSDDTDPPEMDDIEEPDVLIDFEAEVSTVRLVDNLFLPSRLRLRCEVRPALDPAESDFDLAFCKIRFWLDTVVARSVAFGRANEHAARIMLDENGRNRTQNNLMLCPNEPTDDHLATLFQAKMTALAAGSMEFGSVEVRSDNVSGLVFTYVGHHSELLPDVRAWIGERSYFDEPWWARDDASAMDVIPGEDSDLAVPPPWAYSLDFLRQTVQSNEDHVIVRPDFAPRVIDGGRKDEDDET